MMRLPRFLCSTVLMGISAGFVPITSAAAQQEDELSRLIGMYRSGNVEQAATGLQSLIRIAETSERRALLEYHLGLALLRTKPAEGSAALRRSIALDPDSRPQPAATSAERSAWEAVRSQMRIPIGIRFEPATTIAGTGDSLGLVVDVPVATGVAQPTARVLLAVSPGRDPLVLWTGTAGERGMWDGTFGGESPRSGSYPLIVEVFDEAGSAPLRWRRMLVVTADALTQPLALAPRPPSVRAMVPIRVRDTDRRNRARRNGLLWAVGGSIVSFTASRMVPDVIRSSPPNSGSRIALASVYGVGLASTLYGSLKMVRSVTKKYETTINVPDEAVLRRQRSAESAWLADSARVTSINTRPEALRRVTVQVTERR